MMKEKQYELGLVSVSFRPYSPKEILEAAKEAGLSCIEWGSDIHAPCADIARLKEIAAMQKEYGIYCSSYGTYFRLGETPTEKLVDYIHAAKILGTDILRLWCGKKSGKEMGEEERRNMLSVCRSAAQIAQQHEVTLCLECHYNTFTENPDDAVWLMNTVSSSNFRMYWQPFQYQSAKENIANAMKIAPFAEHIHVFHWEGDRMLPLADAVAQWREYMKKFSGPRTLLLEFMPKGTTAELTTEADALRMIVEDCC